MILGKSAWLQTKRTDQLWLRERRLWKHLAATRMGFLDDGSFGTFGDLRDLALSKPAIQAIFRSDLNKAATRFTRNAPMFRRDAIHRIPIIGELHR